MPTIDDLVRDTLRQRAEDVEPTPALWLEVDRRVARRRRLQVVTWSLAGAAAVLVAAAVVPGLLASSDPDLEIFDRVPASAVIPDTFVADVDGRLELHDLATGEVLPFHAAYEMAFSEHRALELAVRPGSSRDDYTIVAVRGGDGEQPAYVEVVDSGETADDVPGTGAGPSIASTTLPETEADPTFRPSVVWAPDTDAVALTLPADADGARLVLWREPRPDDMQIGVQTLEMEVVVERGARLLEWVGSTGQPGDTSWMWIRRPDGTVVTQEVIVQADGSFLDGPTERVQDAGPLLDVASSFASGGDSGEPVYRLAGGADGPVLTWSGGGDRTGAVRLGSVVGDVDPEQLWLDAKQDAALVGDGQRTWLVAHDGDGNFATAVPVADRSARGALFDAPRPGTPEPEAEDPATDVPEPDVTDEAPPVDEQAHVPGAALPEPVLVGDGRELRLLGPDGPETLLAMADEGESWITGVAVRPGSTVDNLTAAVLTTAEGMWDLRELRVVDGQVDEDRYLGAFPPSYRPGGGSSAGEGFAVTGPVWSPDGDSLAWLEIGTGTPTLRVIGWSDGPGTGDTATDNAAFTVDADGTLLLLQEWVEAPSGDPGASEIRAVLNEPDTRSYSLPLLRQPDGAWSQSPDLPTVIGNAGPAGTAAIAALASGETDPDVRWMVRLSDAGAELLSHPSAAAALALPTELLPGEGLPTLWVRSIGDGALVGSPDTATAFYIAPDDSINRLPGGGAAVADVVR